MTASDGRQVLAVILTFNAPDALVVCVEAIRAQSRPPEAILVIDNASSPPPTEALAAAGLGEGLTVLRQADNSGPAGGYAVGLAQFAASAFDVAWVMDDDCVPRRDCLELLMAESSRTDGPAWLFPEWHEPDGKVTRWPAWCGFILDRSIVEEVGVPMAELFWWAEDTEYLWWRIPQAGHPVRYHSGAVVQHTLARRHGIPTWKYYYEARNSVFFHLRIKHSMRRLPRKLVLLCGRALFREHDRRAARLLLIGRGVGDGLRGRLGKRVPVDPEWGK